MYTATTRMPGTGKLLKVGLLPLGLHPFGLLPIGLSQYAQNSHFPYPELQINPIPKLHP